MEQDYGSSDGLESSLFLAALQIRFGADFSGFEEAPIRNRLEAFAARRSMKSISMLQGDILRDHQTGLEAVRALSMSALSPKWDQYRLMALRCTMIPILRSVPWPSIWIADCSDAGFVLLLTAMLAEEDLLGDTQIFVTSASELLVKEIGMFHLSETQFGELEECHRLSGGRNSLRSLLESRSTTTSERPFGHCVTCHSHDVASGGSFREFQAIVCARPLREYGAPLRKRAIQLFGDSLCAFGILHVDNSHCDREALSAHGFAPLLSQQGVFRRAEG